MYKYIFLVLVMLGLSLAQVVFGQSQTFRFEQIDSLQKIQKRPVVVFLHTLWCTYCSAMKNTTFKDAAVIRLLNKDFYFISLNVEETCDIPFRGHTFTYKPTGINTGVHQLAEQLGTINGVLVYPALCFLNADYEIVFQWEGYIKPKELIPILEKVK